MTRTPDCWNKLAELYPAPTTPAASEKGTAVPETFTGEPAPAPEVRARAGAPVSQAAAVTATENTQTGNTQTPASATAPVAPAPVAGPSPARPVARKAAPVATSEGGGDPRFADGPLAVVDVDTGGQVLAYCVGGLVLDVPAKTLPALVEWTLMEAKLGAPKLSGPGVRPAGLPQR